MLHPDVAEELRGTYAGIAHPAFIDHLHDARRHRARAAAGAPVRPRRSTSSTAGCATTGATTRSASSPRTTSTRQRGTDGQQVQEFKQMVKTLHARRHRGDPRRRLQPHRRGQPHGPDAVVTRHRQRSRTTASSPDDPQYYMDYTGTGNTLNMRDPYVLQLVMDSLRYWATEMHVDGFRFDLASRARPQPARGRPAVGVLRPRPAGPRGQQAEADRRAVGRRRGRLPGGQLPAAVGGVERPLPRLHPRPLGGATAHGLGEFAYRITGSSDLYEAAGRSRTRASTSSPPTTASRCATSSPTTRSTTTANGEGNNDGETHNRSWNCGVEGPTDDAGDHRAARPPAAQPAGHAAAVAGRADAARRRRARPHAGRQQQRLLPGQRDLLVRLGARRPGAARLHPPSSSHFRQAHHRRSVAGSSSRAAHCTATRSATSSGTTRAARR